MSNESSPWRWDPLRRKYYIPSPSGRPIYYDENIIELPTSSTSQNIPLSPNVAYSHRFPETQTKYDIRSTSPSIHSVTQAYSPPEVAIGSGQGNFAMLEKNAAFIIRELSSGKVLTLLDEKIVLDWSDGIGSNRWLCREHKGFFGFRNPVTSRYLGYDENGILICSSQKQQRSEHFEARLRPEGGFTLLMMHPSLFEKWHVGSKNVGNEEKLARIGKGGNGGLSWVFEKV